MGGNMEQGTANIGITPEELEHSFDVIRGELSALRFGSIELTVHEGRIVQIDTTRKHRLATKA